LAILKKWLEIGQWPAVILHSVRGEANLSGEANIGGEIVSVLAFLSVTTP